MLAARLRSHIPLITRLFTAQLLVQALNLLNGFTLLRWLSIEDQAIFTVFFSIQTLLSGLSDLGFTGSIIALTGDRISEKGILGSYMASARQLRHLFFLISLPLGLFIAPLVLGHNFPSDFSFWIYLLPLLTGIYWQAESSVFSTPLIIHKSFDQYYRPQVIASTLRLSINYCMFLTSCINSFSVLTLNALVTIFIAWQYKSASSSFFRVKRKNISLYRREMLKYLLPIMPSTIFNVFFGQFQIFLIGYFGTVKNVAEVGALGRLSQIFMLLASFNLLIIEPAIAKCESRQLLRRYLFISVCSLSLALSITTAAFLFPQAFLLLLGDKYQHLDNQLVWLVAAAAVNFLSTTIWNMSSARKWVFWWGTVFYISTVVILQIWGVTQFDLSTTLGVLQLSLLTALGTLFVQLTITIAGFQQRKPQVELSSS